MISNTPWLAANTPWLNARLFQRLTQTCFFALLIAALAPPAHAGFIDQFPLSDFTLVNSPNSQLNNGSVEMMGGSIVLTGGNSGSGEPGTTVLTTTAMTTEMIQFMYSYFSLDVRNKDDAGYLLNGSLFPIAVASGASGIVTLNLTVGEIFGFEVDSADNQFEPGILTISSVGSIATPEPATGSIFALLAGLAIAAGLVKTKRAA